MAPLGLRPHNMQSGGWSDSLLVGRSVGCLWSEDSGGSSTARSAATAMQRVAHDVYMYIHICVYMCIYIYIHIYLHMYMYIFMHLYI